MKRQDLHGAAVSRAAGLLTRATAAIDAGAVRFMERRMGAQPPPIDPEAARVQLIELAREYNTGTLGTPSPFFPVPEAAEVTLTPRGDGPLGTQIVDLAYPSTYIPFLPAARELHDRVLENLTAHARWWTSGRGRPTIVLLHGWAGGAHWLTARSFDVPYWLRHGYDVVSFQLPYHGERAPRGTTIGPRSGQMFPSTNVLRTNEAFGQAIHDLRALAIHLRGRGASAVGVIGMSLGGYTGALWASIAGPADPGGVDFAVGLIPPLSMARVMWKLGADSPVRKRAMKAGISEDLWIDAFAVHTPSTRPVRLPPERLAVVAGKGDRITGPDEAAALAAHWGVPVHWFDGGHLAQIGRDDAIRAVRRQLGALDLPGRVFRP